LKVVGNVQVGTIDSLEQLISLQQQQILTLQGLIVQLQAQIALLESQMAFLGQDLNNADCFGLVGGDAVVDECGVCGGDGIQPDNCDCDNNKLDICGVCGGDAENEDECEYALRFDGDNWIIIPHSSTLDITGGELTIITSIKVTGENGAHAASITKTWGVFPYGGYGMITWNAQQKWSFALANTTLAWLGVWADESYTVNQYQTISGVYDSNYSVAKLFIDGLLNSTSEMTGTIRSVVADLAIGRNPQGSSFNYFIGEIDYVLIFNRALSDQEINEFNHQDFNSDGLVAHYNFNEATGSTLNDISGNNNHGTLMNMDNSHWVQVSP